MDGQLAGLMVQAMQKGRPPVIFFNMEYSFVDFPWDEPYNIA